MSWVLFLLAPSVHAATPDFTGTWQVVPRADTATPPTRGDMGSGWGSPLTITQEENRITIQYAFFAPSDLQAPLTFSCPLDGSESRVETWMGRGAQEQLWRARWDGNGLIITTTHRFVDPTSQTTLPVEVVRTLSLDGPSSLWVETIRAGVRGGAPITTRVRYTKP